MKINGVECSAKPGATILEVARAEGIEIPTLCHLSGTRPLATCRICQVEEMGRGVLLASCVTPVAPGMDIQTDTERVKEARRTIVELLLASHPETCLVCDKHGSCLLRNIAARLGVGHLSVDRVPLRAGKEPATEFIVRDLQKCILCGRCITVCQEVVVQGAIDYHRRGFNTVIATEGEQSLSMPDCHQCAVCVAVCPTGALDHRSRPYRREAPRKSSVICHHCGCGCLIDVSILDGKIVGRLPAAIGDNVPQACARGVYENYFLTEGERIHAPLLRKQESMEEVGWDEAIKNAAGSLEKIIAQHGANSVAVWCSPVASCEEGFLLQKLSREALKTGLIDMSSSGLLKTSSPLRRSDNGAGHPSLCSIGDVEESDLILVIGSGVSQQAPVVDFAIRRAVKFKNARMILIDDGEENPMAKWAHIRMSSKEVMLSLVLAYLGKALLKMVSSQQMEETSHGKEESAQEESTDSPLMGIKGEDVNRAAEQILSAQRLSIVLGFSGKSDQPAADVEEAVFIAQSSWHQGRQMAGILPAGAFTNEIGLLRAGVCSTHAPKGGNFQQDLNDESDGGCGHWGIVSSIEKIRSGGIKGLVVFGYGTLRFMTIKFSKKDETSFLDPLKNLDYLLVIDSRRRPVSAMATALFPLCEHEEREGLFIGIDGAQRISPAATGPSGQSLAGVEIISKLMEAFGNKPAGSLDEIRKEMKEKGIIEL